MTSAGEDAWGRSAAVYDLQLGLERAALGGLARLLDAGPRSRVLDLATGTGGMLRALAGLPEPPEEVVGADRSPAMLRRAAALGLGWELVEADAASIPFGSGSFDRVSIAYLLHLLEPAERAGVLTEVHRLLAPGGLVGVITVAPASGIVPRLLERPVEIAAEIGGGVLAGLRGLDPAPELRRAGLTPLRGLRLRRGYPSLCVVARRGDSSPAAG